MENTDSHRARSRGHKTYLFVLTQVERPFRAVTSIDHYSNVAYYELLQWLAEPRVEEEMQDLFGETGQDKQKQSAKKCRQANIV